MSEPMRVKIFVDTNADALEGKINAWLAALGAASAIVKTETSVAAPAAGKPDSACIVVTVWYEPPQRD